MNLIQKENVKLLKYSMYLKVSTKLANNYFYRVVKDFELHKSFLIMHELGKRARFFCKVTLPGSVPEEDGCQPPEMRRPD